MIHLRTQRCRHFAPQLWDYATGELHGASKVRLEEHLVGCARCRQELALEQRLTATFAAARSRPLPTCAGNFAAILPHLQPAARGHSRRTILLTGAGSLCGALAVALLLVVRSQAPQLASTHNFGGTRFATVAPNSAGSSAVVPVRSHPKVVIAADTHRQPRAVVHPPIRLAMLPTRHHVSVQNAVFHPRSTVGATAKKALRSRLSPGNNSQMELASLDGAGQQEPRSRFEYVMAPVSMSAEQQPQRHYVIGGYGAGNVTPTTASWSPESGDSTAW
ncbi:MAG: zf-HC2 domain-containing protein [Armatimonadetes bacterium]|nr:zf-HC2 domain-containing protein [Armatimonadota bacterium]MDE2207385.1 zf-HC2 domain-containing protein [Armatimonadota bacterium]